MLERGESEYKLCRSCGEEKLKVHFFRDSHCKDGLTSQCRTCTRIKRQKKSPAKVAKHLENWAGFYR